MSGVTEPPRDRTLREKKDTGLGSSSERGSESAAITKRVQSVVEQMPDACETMASVQIKTMSQGVVDAYQVDEVGYKVLVSAFSFFSVGFVLLRNWMPELIAILLDSVHVPATERICVEHGS